MSQDFCKCEVNHFGFWSLLQRIGSTICVTIFMWMTLSSQSQSCSNLRASWQSLGRMPSLYHGAIFIGAFLIVTGGSTAFLTSHQSRLQAFSLCCVVLGVVMLIFGLFWAMNSKGTVNYNHQEFDPECPHYPYDYTNYPGHALFSTPGNHLPESQSVFLPRWVKERNLHSAYVYLANKKKVHFSLS